MPTALDSNTQAIVDRHTSMVYATCLRALGDAASAEDAAQAVFIIYHRKAASLGGEVNLAAWLHRTAVFVSREAKRNALIRQTHETEAAAMRQRAMQSTEPDSSEALRAAIDECLERLPAAQREAIVLRYLEDRSEEDAARELKIPVGTLSARVSRALAALRAQLKRRGIVVTLAALLALLSSDNALAAAGAASCSSPHAVAFTPSSRAYTLAEETLKIMSPSKLLAAIAGAVATLACCATLVWHGALEHDSLRVAEESAPPAPAAQPLKSETPQPAPVPSTSAAPEPIPAPGDQPSAGKRNVELAVEPEPFVIPLLDDLPPLPDLNADFDIVFVQKPEESEPDKLFLRVQVHDDDFPPLPPDILPGEPFQIPLPPPPPLPENLQVDFQVFHVDENGERRIVFPVPPPAIAPQTQPQPAPENAAGDF